MLYVAAVIKTGASPTLNETGSQQTGRFLIFRVLVTRTEDQSDTERPATRVSEPPCESLVTCLTWEAVSQFNALTGVTMLSRTRYGEHTRDTQNRKDPVVIFVCSEETIEDMDIQLDDINKVSHFRGRLILGAQGTGNYGTISRRSWHTDTESWTPRPRSGASHKILPSSSYVK